MCLCVCAKERPCVCARERVRARAREECVRVLVPAYLHMPVRECVYALSPFAACVHACICVLVHVCARLRACSTLMAACECARVRPCVFVFSGCLPAGKSVSVGVRIDICAWDGECVCMREGRESVSVCVRGRKRDCVRASASIFAYACTRVCVCVCERSRRVCLPASGRE